MDIRVYCQLVMSMTIIKVTLQEQTGYTFDAPIFEVAIGEVINMDYPKPPKQSMSRYTLTEPNGDKLHFDIPDNCKGTKIILKRSTDGYFITEYSNLKLNEIKNHQQHKNKTFPCNFTQSSTICTRVLDQSEQIPKTYWQKNERRQRDWSGSNKEFSDSLYNKKRETAECEVYLELNTIIEDHGNWVVSTAYEDNGFIQNNHKIFSVIVSETVPIRGVTGNGKMVLRTGDKLTIQFNEDLGYLEACELLTPKNAGDREYEYKRDSEDVGNCIVVVNNVQTKDSGVWKLYGVGNIVYKGNINVMVLD